MIIGATCILTGSNGSKKLTATTDGFGDFWFGRLRDECMNVNWFMNLKHAREIIEDWRKDYNDVRPHSSLKGNTPKEYAEAAIGLWSVLLLILGEATVFIIPPQ